MNYLNIAALTNKTIGLISPSSPCSVERLKGAIAYFEQRGIKVKTGHYHDRVDRFLAGTDRQRAADVMQHICDSDVDLLVVTGAGAGSGRILPFLAHSLISQHQKPIIGFSDTTTLQLGLYARSGLKSYTGFTCRDAVEPERMDAAIERTFACCVLQQNYEIVGAKTVNAGQTLGPLIGGNLSCMVALMGTAYQPDFRNHILIIEDVWAEPFLIDMMLNQLFLAGVFDQIVGLVFGQFYGCNPRSHPDRDGSIDDIINDWALRLDIPVMKDFHYGHMPSRSLWPIGVNGLLDTTTGRLSILFS